MLTRKAALATVLAVWILSAGIAAPTAPDTVARIDDEALSRQVLAVFVASARLHDPETSPRQVLDNLVDVHLMGAWYREAYAGDAPPARVGYDRATLARQDLAALTRVAWREPLAATLNEWGWSSPMQALQASPRLDDPQLAAILTPRPGLRMGFNEQQRLAAGQWVVARYRFPGAGERRLTLLELYRAQNIALKTRFHNLDREAMGTALATYLQRAFVLDWFERRAPLSDDERGWVRQLVLDRQDQRGLMLALGLSDDPHDDNVRLREVADGIPAKEIERYYQLNREQFTRVEKVRAALLWLPSQTLADAAARRLAEGADLQTLARDYADREGAGYQPPHWLERGGPDAWLAGFAFTRRPGQPSPPTRAPGAEARWVIVRVDERVEGHQPMDSESVRYQASRALARARLLEHLRTGLARRHDAADVRIYPEAL